MANNRSAEKRNRQNTKRRDRNRAVRSELRTKVKTVRTALETGDVAAAEEHLSEAIRVVDVTAQKGVIHRNAAARTKSRLTKAVATAKSSA